MDERLILAVIAIIIGLMSFFLNSLSKFRVISAKLSEILRYLTGTDKTLSKKQALGLFDLHVSANQAIIRKEILASKFIDNLLLDKPNISTLKRVIQEKPREVINNSRDKVQIFFLPGGVSLKKFLDDLDKEFLDDIYKKYCSLAIEKLNDIKKTSKISKEDAQTLADQVEVLIGLAGKESKNIVEEKIENLYKKLDG